MYVSNDQSSKSNPSKSDLPKKKSQAGGYANQKPETPPEEIEEPTNPESPEDDEPEQKVTP